MPATLIAPLNSCVGLFLLEDDFPEFSVERIAVRPKMVEIGVPNAMATFSFAARCWVRS